MGRGGAKAFVMDTHNRYDATTDSGIPDSQGPVALVRGESPRTRASAHLPGVRAGARLLRRQGLARRHDRVVLVLAVDVLVQEVVVRQGRERDLPPGVQVPGSGQVGAGLPAPGADVGLLDAVAP